MHQPVFDDSTMTWSEPEVVQTTKGLWPAAGLERVVTFDETEAEWNSAVEYRIGDDIVHRSARTHLKQGLRLDGGQAAFG